jgi:hypothetical protein
LSILSKKGGYNMYCIEYNEYRNDEINKEISKYIITENYTLSENSRPILFGVEKEAEEFIKEITNFINSVVDKFSNFYMKTHLDGVSYEIYSIREYLFEKYSLDKNDFRRRIINNMVNNLFKDNKNDQLITSLKIIAVEVIK